MRPFRLVHVTDLHYRVPLRLSQLVLPPSKRILGAINLYAFGRAFDFSQRAQDAAVQAASGTKMDALVVTGDLTSMGTPQEYALAKSSLRPLLESSPSAMVLPGNHDIYTKDTLGRFEDFFGPWIGESRGCGVFTQHIPEHSALVIGLHVCRPFFWDSSGRVPNGLSYVLEEVLEACEAAEAARANRLILALHYPLVHAPSQRLYHKVRPYLALRHVDGLLGVLARTENKPSLILHGHEHTAGVAEINGIKICNPGASGHTKGAAFNVYEFDSAQSIALYHYRSSEDKQRFIHQCENL